MTPEQLTLARQFCEAVGWRYETFDGTTWITAPGGYGARVQWWLFTGDGMLAVKAEMAKRDVAIISGPCLFSEGSFYAFGKYAAPSILGGQTILDFESFVSWDSEPEAVLMAAVAAMKGVPSE